MYLIKKTDKSKSLKIFLKIMKNHLQKMKKCQKLSINEKIKNNK